MANSKKNPSGWGDLNVALNKLVKGKVILGYTTGKVRSEDEVAVEVTIDKGADQADIVRQVRDALPSAFSGASVRTKAEG